MNIRNILNSLRIGYDPKRERTVKEAFTQTFKDDRDHLKADAAVVLAHMATFCCADTSTVVYDNQGRVDRDATNIMIGRREVWLLFSTFIKIPDQEFAEADRMARRQLRPQGQELGA